MDNNIIINMFLTSGSNSITTLGTISSGTWNASTISRAKTKKDVVLAFVGDGCVIYQAIQHILNGQH